jgi:DNA-binding NarL/FixJ family response regulator
MIRVLICDDQAIVRDGLRLMLELEPDLVVIGAVQHGAEALALLAHTEADLVLMDLSMPVMNGVEATRSILQRHPTLPVLVLTTYDADEWVFDAIRAGAAGYLLKDTPREVLMTAIRGTVAGRGYVDPAITGKLLHQVAQGVGGGSGEATDWPATLSEREQAVLRLIARGHTNAEIAQRLHLAEGTVRNYVSTLLLKLNVADRTQAAIMAIRHGFG